MRQGDFLNKKVCNDILEVVAPDQVAPDKKKKLPAAGAAAAAVVAVSQAKNPSPPPEDKSSSPAKPKLTASERLSQKSSRRSLADPTKLVRENSLTSAVDQPGGTMSEESDPRVPHEALSEHALYATTMEGQDAAERLLLCYPRFLVGLVRRPVEERVALPPPAMLPPINITTLFESLSDTLEGAMSFLRLFKGMASWDPTTAAKHFFSWSRDGPLHHHVAAQFIRQHRLLLLCTRIPKSVPIGRHVSTADSLEMLNESLRALLEHAMGYHVGYTVCIASATRRLGKTTLMQQLTSPSLQTTAMGRTRVEVTDSSGATAKSENPDLPCMKIKWAPQTGFRPTLDSQWLVDQAPPSDRTANPPLLFKITLSEIHWDGSNAARSQARFAALCLFLVADSYTLDQFEANVAVERDFPRGCDSTPVLVYAPKPQAPMDILLENRVVSIAEKHGIPYASVDIMDFASVARLQRLLVQWMVPVLQLPIDPRLVPRTVDVGALVLQNDVVLNDYLARTATLVGKKEVPAAVVALPPSLTPPDTSTSKQDKVPSTVRTTQSTQQPQQPAKQDHAPQKVVSPRSIPPNKDESPRRQQEPRRASRVVSPQKQQQPAA